MKLKRRTMTPVWTVVSLILCILAAFFTVIMIQPDSVFPQLGYFFAHPFLLLLNLFPIAVTIVVFYMICGNVFYSAAVGSLIWNLLSYVNLLKIEGRDDPFTPGDITLIREAVNATGEYDLNLHPGHLLIIGFMTLGLAALGYFFKSRRPNWIVRTSVGVGLAALFITSVVFLYPQRGIYVSFPTANEYNITVVFNTRGFPYCFLYNVNSYSITKPDGYSENEVREWIDSEKADKKELAVKPNVIFVMCEAFSDLSEEDAFIFDEANDPLRDYKTVCASDRAVSGHIVVSNINAGTANTEFDVLTGLQTNMVSPTNSSSLRVIRRDIPSLPRTYMSAGYSSFFIHPGHSWFYNRHSAYDHIGISDQIFKEAFGEEDYKGTMISDEAFFNKLKANFEQRIAGGNPLFVYGVTIQNHQSYKYGKFGDTPDSPKYSVDVSHTTDESVSVYLEGVRDSSAMVLRLAEYLDTVDQPTVLVFFGDHRPALGGNMTAYNELGLYFGDSEDPEQTIRTYETPYVIYCNRAYAEAVDIPAALESLDLGDDSVISDIYLGSCVYELTGMSGRDGYYDFLTKARRQLPVVCKESYMLPDGTFTRDISDSQYALVEKLHKWLYYPLLTQPTDLF